MKNMIIATALFVSMNSFAHFEIGTYQGTNNGEACSINFKDVTFAYNVHNPVNEKVEVVIGDETFFIGHAASFDASTSKIGFDKNNLSGTKGTEVGAKFLTVHMDHARAGGPEKFLKVDHNWKTGEVKTVECTGLEFLGR